MLQTRGNDHESTGEGDFKNVGAVLTAKRRKDRARRRSLNQPRINKQLL
jgi:hypothetical protein